jgi:hypothetical protein
VLAFLERSPNEVELAEFKDNLFDRWSNRLVKKHDLPPPDRDHGLVVQRVDLNEAAASYVSKMAGLEGGTSDKPPLPSLRQTAMEVTRHDLKTGHGESLAPFELLDAYEEAEARGNSSRSEAWAALWNEYVAATARRQCQHWSRGLKELLEVTELVDGEEEASGTDQGSDDLPDGLVVDLSGDRWAALAVADAGTGPAVLLDLAENRLWWAAEQYVALCVASWRTGRARGQPRRADVDELDEF